MAIGGQKNYGHQVEHDVHHIHKIISLFLTFATQSMTLNHIAIAMFNGGLKVPKC